MGKLKKYFAIYLLLTFACSQFAFAQHNASHISPDHHSKQQNTDNEQDGDSDICQICAVTKNLGQKFLLFTNIIFSFTKPSYRTFFLQKIVSLKLHYKPFRSQAPPIFSLKKIILINF